MELNVENVKNVFFSCLFDDKELKNGRPPKELWAMGGGIVRQVVFDKRKIEQKEEDIKSLLSQLPESFFSENGSCFVNMPTNKKGELWGEQMHAEQLYQLGKAAGFIWNTPRELWPISFGVPIIIINLDKKFRSKE